MYAKIGKKSNISVFKSNISIENIQIALYNCEKNILYINIVTRACSKGVFGQKTACEKAPREAFLCGDTRKNDDRRLFNSTERNMETVKRRKFKEKVIRSTKEKIIHEVVFIFFLVYTFTLIYPFLFLLMNSFKDYEAIADFPMQMPKADTIVWDSYLRAWFSMDIARMFFNTVTLSVGQTFVSMALTCMAAYTLAKYPFKANTIIYTIILVASVVSTFGAEASTFQLMDKLNLRNKYIGMLVMCGGFGSAFLYLHSFFKGIPWSFAESAMLDGASEFRIFLQIMLPLAKNGIMVFTIMKFIGYWNEYWSVMLYYCNIGDGFKHHWTLSVGLTKLSQNRNIKKNVFYAGTVICIIPALIFYAVFSNKLMGNLNAGGIKG